MTKTPITRSLPFSMGLSRPVRMLLATLSLAVVAGFAQTATAQPMGPRGGMHGDMGGPGGHGGRGGGMLGGPHLGRMLDLVNATADQRAQIKTITDAARADLKAQRDAGQALHQQMQAAFAATTVDANVVESLRQKIQAQRDTASKRMTQAMIDVSRVLTPEQRKTLADAMAKRQAMMQRHAAERAALEKPAK